MPKLSYVVPKYRRHRASGQAVVTLQGRDVYLGPWQSKVSKLEYDRVIGEWLAAGRPQLLSPRISESITVSELILSYWTFARAYYVKHGRATAEQAGIKVALRFLRQYYGHTLAAAFGPLALEALQGRMVEAKQSRKYINENIARIKRCFKWGVRQELVPVTVYQALLTLPGLCKGKTVAREPDPIGPVAWETVEATLLRMPSQLADMVRLQRLIACRPGELCDLRPCDIDTSGDVWCYVPREHKMEHVGRQRRILIGPRAQELLRPYLLRDADAFCFLTPVARTKYDAYSYRSAIYRACDRAFPPPVDLDNVNMRQWRKSHRWAPNRLRHSAATEIRRQFGLEAAQVALGHASADVSQLYAERDLSLAAHVMKKIG